jgi:hypothetical protein
MFAITGTGFKGIEFLRNDGKVRSTSGPAA